MALVLGQSDTAASFGNVAMCSGLTVGTTPINCQLNPSAASGASSHSFTCAASGTNSALVFMQCAANTPGIVSWASGNWIVNLNFSTVNSNLTWSETFICRANSGGTNQATVGSLTGQAVTLSSSSTMTVSGSSQAAASTDVVYIVCAFTNAKSSSQSASVTFNQTITTPLISIAEIVGMSEFDSLAAFENIRKIYSFSKTRFRDNYRVDTFTDPGQMNEIPPPPQPEPSRTYPDLIYRPKYRPEQQEAFYIQNVVPEQTLPMDDQTEYPDFVLRPAYRSSLQQYFTTGTQPENTISLDWKPQYVDSVFRPALKTGDQQFFASTIRPENTISLDWNPLYVDRVVRPTYNASEQPFHAASMQPEGQIQLEWQAYFPDRIYRPSYGVGEQLFFATSMQPEGQLPLDWQPEFPDRIVRTQLATAEQAFYTANILPILPPFIMNVFTVYPDTALRRTQPAIQQPYFTKDYLVVPPPVVPTFFQASYPDFIVRPKSTSLLLDASELALFATLPAAPRFLGAFDVNLNSTTSGTTSSQDISGPSGASIELSISSGISGSSSTGGTFR